MEKKSFLILLSILLVTFVAVTVIKHYRPSVTGKASLSEIPLTCNQWLGQVDSLPLSVIDLLSPDQFFSAFYVNRTGDRVQVFVDYYSPENRSGAIHSPRNCLPGSGWAILGSTPRGMSLDGRQINASRFSLQLGESRQVMDFWYVTRHGETANDYILKLNTMISALTLRPTDQAFIRFVALDDPQSVAAMEEFETQLTPDIYRYLPF
jgi:EpsI family protein